MGMYKIQTKEYTNAQVYKYTQIQIYTYKNIETKSEKWKIQVYNNTNYLNIIRNITNCKEKIMVENIPAIWACPNCAPLKKGRCQNFCTSPLKISFLERKEKFKFDDLLIVDYN